MVLSALVRAADHARDRAIFPWKLLHEAADSGAGVRDRSVSCRPKDRDAKLAR